MRKRGRKHAQSAALVKGNERREERTCCFLLAWMAPRPATLPLKVLKASEDWPSLRDALSELAKASLVGWPFGTDEIFIHRVLQAVTRYGQKEEERRSSLESALTRLNASLPDPEWNEAGWQLWRRLSPHLNAMLQRADALGLATPSLAFACARFGYWLNKQGRFGEAEPLCRRALAIRERCFGSEHLERFDKPQ